MTLPLKRLFERQDEEMLISFARDLVNIPSETGDEEAISNWLSSALADLGFEIERQEVEDGRTNVIARTGHVEAGKKLMLLAHFDTSTVPGENLPTGFQPIASIEDGWLRGLGASNMKSAFAAYASAWQMLRDAGVRLRGQLIIAGVVGEILKAPVDEWQGKRFRGAGSGARYMVSHGTTADYCINGEPTGLRLQPNGGGYAFFKIRVEGSPQETYSKDLAVDPLPIAFRIHAALQEWEAEYQRQHAHPQIRPQLLVGGIYGGYPFKPHITAPSCTLYVHVQMLPGQNLLGLQRDLERIIAAAVGKSAPFTVAPYCFEDGYVLDSTHVLPRAIEEAHRVVFGRATEPPNPERSAISSDNNTLAAYGIPAVTYGPGGINLSGNYSMYEPGVGEVVNVGNLIGYARAIAVAASELLGYDD